MVILQQFLMGLLGLSFMLIFFLISGALGYSLTFLPYARDFFHDWPTPMRCFAGFVLFYLLAVFFAVTCQLGSLLNLILF